MKKFIKNLFGNLFNRENRNVASSVSNATTSVQTEEDKKKRERNALLVNIFWTVQTEQLKQLDILEKYVQEYKTLYGPLTGQETALVSFNDGDSYFPYWVEVEKPLLIWAGDLTKKFFFALVNGKKDKVEEYRHKIDLQNRLREAFDNNDIITFDKLLTEGADINYRYPSSGEHTEKLWNNLSRNSRMYEYFMTRNDVPEVNKIKAEQELIASRKATMA